MKRSEQMTSDSEAMLLRPSYLACADRLRREARLCDITLYVPGRTGAMVGYTAHRVMLVAASKYFKHLFERDELHKTCYLLHLTEDGLSVVLDVVYGRGINSQMNLADALVAARFLQVDGATELLERNRDQMKSSSSPSSKRKRRLSGGSHSWSNSQTHPPAEPSGGFCQKQSESDTLVQRPVLLFQNLQSKYEGPISKEKEEVWNQDSGNQDMLPRHNDSTLMETGHKDVGDTDTYTDVLSGAVSVKNEPFRDVETAADNHEIGFAHTDSFPQQTFATRGADVASGVCSFEASHDDDMPAFSVSDHGQQIRYECDICDCEFSKAAALREHHALHKVAAVVPTSSQPDSTLRLITSKQTSPSSQDTSDTLSDDNVPAPRSKQLKSAFTQVHNRAVSDNDIHTRRLRHQRSAATQVKNNTLYDSDTTQPRTRKLRSTFTQVDGETQSGDDTYTSHPRSRRLRSAFTQVNDETLSDYNAIRPRSRKLQSTQVGHELLSDDDTPPPRYSHQRSAFTQVDHVTLSDNEILPRFKTLTPTFSKVSRDTASRPITRRSAFTQVESSELLDYDTSPPRPMTPVKRRRWVGPVHEMVQPMQYRPQEMLWGTNTCKHRLGMRPEEEIPRTVADARNHFRAAVKHVQLKMGLKSLAGRKNKALVQSLIKKVIVFCPRLEEMEHQEILIRVREIVRCNLSCAIQKKKRLDKMGKSRGQPRPTATTEDQETPLLDATCEEISASSAECVNAAAAGKDEKSQQHTARSGLAPHHDAWGVGDTVMCRSEDGQSICSGKVVQCPAFADGLEPHEENTTASIRVEAVYRHGLTDERLPLLINDGCYSDITRRMLLYWPKDWIQAVETSK